MNPSVLKVLQVCGRRWYVVLPILAVAAWYSFSYYTSIKPVYYANAVVAATSSNEQLPYGSDGRGAPRNGLLDLGGASLIMNMGVLGFDDPGVRERVALGGGKGNFTARMFPSPPGAVQAPLPLIMIEATEPDAVSATKTVELAADQVEPILAGVQAQAGVPESQMVRAVKALDAEGGPGHSESQQNDRPYFRRRSCPCDLGCVSWLTQRSIWFGDVAKPQPERRDRRPEERDIRASANVKSYS